MKGSLQLRQGLAAEWDPCAWFLPGNSAGQWLEELARCELATPETRLYLVPRSVADRSVAGLLLIPGPHARVRGSPRGMPLRVIAGRLFVPVDAVLVPPVMDVEVRKLCPMPVIFYHPALGLSGYEAEPTLRIWDLLAPATWRADRWNAARSGLPALPTFSGVVLAEVPTLEDVFGDAASEIASESPARLPRAPDELGAAMVRELGERLGRAIQRCVAAMLGTFPNSTAFRALAGDLKRRASADRAVDPDQLQELRLMELHRLLHMLTHDPERGLRHAIPFGHGSNRGLAPPSARLKPRSLEYDPSRRGGKPTDHWEAPPAIQERLRRRYREIADRELRLGRFRRAAYIYAELLGDPASAAAALKQGRLFREAAVVYEQLLQNPLEAARCLAEGGLLAEAAERFEKLGLWLEVAEVLERMGNRAGAVAAVRRIVQERLANADILGAAALLESRLQAPEEALRLLLGGWPASPQAVGCVTAAFELCARLGRHQEVLDWLAQLSPQTLPSKSALPILGVLVPVAGTYPHSPVRDLAADRSRVLVAVQLQRTGLPENELRTLIDRLITLVPKDRLLARDGHRYLDARKRRLVEEKRRGASSRSTGQLEVLRRFKLPRDVHWMRLGADGLWLYAAGLAPGRLVFARGNWANDIQSLDWRIPGVDRTPAADLVLEHSPAPDGVVALGVRGAPPLELKRLPGLDDGFRRKDCHAGTPAFLANGQFPFVYGSEVVWAVHSADDRVILSCHDKEGRLLRTVDVTPELRAVAARAPILLGLVREKVVLASGNRLVAVGARGALARIDLPGEANGLVAGQVQGPDGAAILLAGGATMWWSEAEGLTELEHDHGFHFGVALDNRRLMLVSNTQVAIYRWVDERPKRTLFSTPVPEPVAVSAIDQDHVLLLGAHGEVVLCAVPL